MASVGDFPYVPVHYKEVSGDPQDGKKNLDFLFKNFKEITIFSEKISLNSSRTDSSNRSH